MELSIQFLTEYIPKLMLDILEEDQYKEHVTGALWTRTQDMPKTVQANLHKSIDHVSMNDLTWF